MRDTNGLESYRQAILAAHPDLAPGAFALLHSGWDCAGVDVDDRLIFKFPRSPAAEQALKKEAALLAHIRPLLSLPVPEMTIYDGPPLFSGHGKLKGRHLLSSTYCALPEDARDRLAASLALFYAQLHGLDPDTMRAAGAEPVQSWDGAAAEIQGNVWAVLPRQLRPFAARTLAAWQDLPPDPYGTVFGFFDGHGWNMAFDAETLALRGIYDFASAGFGPLHQDFFHSNFIAPDLTARLVTHYERGTGRRLDRSRIAILTSVQLLWELSVFADSAGQASMLIRSIAQWVSSPEARF